ncbi:uncharacterized protein LOC132547746 [Ylistrum balloti]|uniref:uncharacterized protein LOC132547746 n=1 Tax=Ylistrum balloti TaxID=509963 RepID=UPI002905A16C|nr:uncharacterized protein LOC132547746 [Ylistrum balloti]
MSAIYGQDPLSPFARPPGTVDNQLWSPRLKPRWGEYDVISKDGRDCRVSDGLSRFRSNFDCCHQAEVVGSHDPIDTFGCHRLPKPLEADHSGMVAPHKTDRHVTCDPQVDVFPLHDRERKDQNGEYVLHSTTRSAIESTHSKLYCTSRYSSMYPGDPSPAMYQEQEVPDVYEPMAHPACLVQDPYEGQDNGVYSSAMNDFCDIPVGSCGDTANYVDSSYEPSFFSPKASQRRTRESACNENQNFHDLLIQDVYRYRLPSILHYPGGFESDQTVPDVMSYEEEKQKDGDISYGCSKFLRPAIPSTLIRDMADLKMEMELSKQTQMLPERKFSNQRPLPSIDSWTQWPHQPNLNLAEKSETQKRFNITHPETKPDPRDFDVYSKRVFFNGFNSSAFRG